MMRLLLALGGVALLVLSGFWWSIPPDLLTKLERYVNSDNVLSNMEKDLVAARKARADLEEMAGKFRVESEVALIQVKRLEEEKEKIIGDFRNADGIARNAGLPKYAEATPEDLEKLITIGTRNYTGEQLYRLLREDKIKLERADAAITRERMRSDFYKDRAEKIRVRMPRIDDQIVELQHDIDDYKMLREFLKVNGTLKTLGLSEDRMTELLDTGSSISAGRKEIDRMRVEIELDDSRNEGEGLREAIRGGSSYSVTGDDLI